MENSDVNKILDLCKRKRLLEFYEHYNLDWKKNKWLKISNFSEFNFVEEIINKDLKKSK